MNVVIRPLTITDNLKLAGLIRTVFREFKIDRPGTVYTDPSTDNLYELFRNKDSAYWVAEVDGTLAGGCGIFPTPGLPAKYAELVKFYLLPEYRGFGIGKDLLEASFKTAIEKGFSHVYLESFPELDTAVGIYEKAGFYHISAAMGDSGHFACSLWMVKDLLESVCK